mgnify:FL=1
MPKIQLIRRDGKIIELDAETITFGFQRYTTSDPIPVLATRAAIDLNQTGISITVNGVIADDDSDVAGIGSSMSLDLSVGAGAIGGSWYASGSYASWSDVKTDLDGVEIVFRSAGQVSAGLGENITIQLKNGSGSSTVATKSIIVVNISSTTHTQGLSDAINTALSSANVHLSGGSTAFTNLFTVTQLDGQMNRVSYFDQVGSVGNYAREQIQLTNKTTGSNGDVRVTVQKAVGSTGSGQTWTKKFRVTNFTNGSDSARLTRGDKLQDLINSISNASAGGALVSPQVLTGSLLDVPDAVASVDASQFLRIDQQPAVKKYIVGIRIPYESVASSTDGNPVLRQFLIPAGPGTDFSSKTNTESFDPVDVVNGVSERPNPFLRQGIAIPAIIQNFDPSYNAGDSVWTYQLTMAAVEQLVGI